MKPAIERAAPSQRAWYQQLSDYLELTKPRLSMLVLATTGVGFWLGMPGAQPLSIVVPLLLGTGLVVGGANVINEWIERDLDGLMQRTRHRPLPAGRLAPIAAWRFGLALSITGVILLGLWVNWLSALLAAVSWISYVLCYTPMKRWTPLCTLVGAIPGALPPVIGWAGARNALTIEAWALFAILFVWQLPHFLALALLYRDDYARAGFHMLPLMASGPSATARQMVLYGLVLLPASLFPALIGLTNGVYFFGALILSVLFFGVTVRAAWHRSLPCAQQLFISSVVYLPILLTWLACNRTSLRS